MLCDLGEEERTRFRKKRKNLIAAKSGLVGMKGYLKTCNGVKYFFATLKPFLYETALCFIRQRQTFRTVSGYSNRSHKTYCFEILCKHTTH